MLSYYLLAPLLYLLSALPTKLLYGLSNRLAFVLRVIVRYRKDVVYTNLTHAFPQKSAAEVAAIAQQSYQHLADRVVENIKCLRITPNEIDQRIRVENMELFTHYHHQNRQIIIMVGHIAAWEFAGYKLSLSSPYKTFGIVSTLHNKRFNDLLQRTRGKMGMRLIPMQEAKELFHQKLTELYAGVFISDQSPSNPQSAYWTTFLNQETAFFTGAERFARLHDCVVLYAEIVQTARGYYRAKLHPISEYPRKEAEHAITEKFVRLLENQLQRDPADWLWSHKRWKHKRQAEK